MAAFRGWAPDGQHLLVDTAPNGGQSVLDLNGDEVLHVHGWDVAWVDSSTIAVVGDQTNLPVRTATLYDLSGAQVGQIAGEFEEFLFAPGHRVATGRSIANGNESQGGRYEIWDGAALSDWHDGIPVAWSPDASKLAIVHPNGTPYRPGVAGSLAIVDAAGRPLLAVADWVTGTTWQQLFSPDGRYLAACLWRSGSPEEIAVVNVESGEVQKVANGCGYLMEWTSYPSLYLYGDSAPVWSPDFGGSISGFDLPLGLGLDVALDGDIAYWTPGGSGSVLSVIHDGATRPYRLPGPIGWAFWSPDGTSIVAQDSTTASVTFLHPGLDEPPPTLPPARINQGDAEAIARSFFTAPETHGSGSTANGVEITSIALAPGDVFPQQAWRVAIDGTVTDAAGTRYTSAFILSIDAQTGEVTVIAQG